MAGKEREIVFDLYQKIIGCFKWAGELTYRGIHFVVHTHPNNDFSDWVSDIYYFGKGWYIGERVFTESIENPKATSSLKRQGLAKALEILWRNIKPLMAEANNA